MTRIFICLSTWKCSMSVLLFFMPADEALKQEIYIKVWHWLVLWISNSMGYNHHQAHKVCDQLLQMKYHDQYSGGGVTQLWVFHFPSSPSLSVPSNLHLQTNPFVSSSHSFPILPKHKSYSISFLLELDLKETFCVLVAGLLCMYVYMPLAGSWEHMRRSKGNCSCFISRLYYSSICRQACVRITLSRKIKKYKNTLTGIISPL